MSIKENSLKEKSTAKPKKKKIKKDPQAPKKPKSGYILFTIDNRSQITQKNPNKKVTEILKILGKMWKKVSPQEKKKYSELSKKDKIRYEKEYKEYVNSGKKDSWESGQQSESKSSPKKKRGKTAYNFFHAEQWSIIKKELNNGELNSKDLQKAVRAELSIRWKQTKKNKEKYKIYENKSIEDKKRLENQISSEENTSVSINDINLSESESKSDTNVEKNKKLAKNSNKGYVIFSQEKIKSSNKKYKAKKLLKMWNKLSGEKKDFYIKKAKEII